MPHGCTATRFSVIMFCIFVHYHLDSATKLEYVLSDRITASLNSGRNISKVRQHTFPFPHKQIQKIRNHLVPFFMLQFAPSRNIQRPYFELWHDRFLPYSFHSSPWIILTFQITGSTVWDTEITSELQSLHSEIEFAVLESVYSLSQRVYSLSQRVYNLSQSVYSLSQSVYSLSQRVHSLSQSI
jgi:hypothetical protein